ncbi:MAG: hypothetical protein NVS3B3_08210 [Aquirhabdus sp.]
MFAKTAKMARNTNCDALGVAKRKARRDPSNIQSAAFWLANRSEKKLRDEGSSIMGFQLRTLITYDLKKSDELKNAHYSNTQGTQNPKSQHKIVL